jgi:thioredoxin 1
MRNYIRILRNLIHQQKNQTKGGKYMSEITITSANFESEVLQSDMPVLVDFWASWCGPCKMLAPTISEIASEYEGKVKVGKVNIDDDTAIAIKYGIVSIPTVVLFKNGEVADKSVGFVPKAEIEAMLK